MSTVVETPERALVLLDAARRSIAEAKTIDDLMLIRDRLEAMRYAAKQAKVQQEIVNDCAEMKLRTERRIGEMLIDMPKNEGGRPITGNTMLPVSDDTPTYADLGIEKMQASRWQSVASVPEEEFEQHIAETKAAGEELTTASVLLAAILREQERYLVKLGKPGADALDLCRRALRQLSLVDVLDASQGLDRREPVKRATKRNREAHAAGKRIIAATESPKLQPVP